MQADTCGIKYSEAETIVLILATIHCGTLIMMVNRILVIGKQANLPTGPHQLSNSLQVIQSFVDTNLILVIFDH
jgi:Tfp pilus assembly pilus retraction ATPase PilT